MTKESKTSFFQIHRSVKNAFAFLILSIIILCVTSCSRTLPPDQNNEQHNENDVPASYGANAALDEAIEEQTPETPKAEVTATVTYNSVKPYFDNVIRIEVAGKYGIINNNGDIVIEPKYEELKPVSYDKNTGLLQFKKYNNYFGLYQIGIVTTDGKEVVEAVYDDIAYTADNDDSTILLTKYIEGGDKNDTENIIGSYGSHTFNDRELSVYLLKENCTIDLDFAEYKFLLSSPKLYYFNVFSYTDKGGNRKFYMPLRYEEDDYCLIFDSLGNFVSAISNSDTPYKTKAWRTNNQKYLVLSSTEVLDLEKDELVEAFLSNDKLLRYDLVKGNSLTGDLIPYTYGFMNIKGEHVIEYSDYHIFLALDDGYYLTWSNSGSYEGIVSADGKEIVKPIYDDVDGPIDGYFSVSFGGDVDNNKVKAYFGCVNSEGVLTSPVQWEGSSQQDFFDAHTFGSKNVIVNPADGTYTEYAKATHLHGKFYLISDGNKIGFATWSEPLTECIYDKADEESDFISYDEKVMVGRIGKTYTIYSLHV